MSVRTGNANFQGIRIYFSYRRAFYHVRAYLQYEKIHHRRMFTTSGGGKPLHLGGGQKKKSLFLITSSPLLFFALPSESCVSFSLICSHTLIFMPFPVVTTHLNLSFCLRASAHVFTALIAGNISFTPGQLPPVLMLI